VESDEASPKVLGYVRAFLPRLSNCDESSEDATDPCGFAVLVHDRVYFAGGCTAQRELARDSSGHLDRNDFDSLASLLSFVDAFGG